MSVEPQSCSSDVLEDDPPLSGAVVSASSGATDAMDRPPPPRVAWENNTTEKHTKKKNLIRSSWEAVKHPNQSQETKVCAFVPEQESEQELPHTSSVEPTDRESPVINTQNACVGLQKVRRKKRSPPKERRVPQDFTLPEIEKKHTKKKNLIRRAWEAVKHPNQSQETKVCAFVPEQEQELPHTSSVEPTDQKHTKKKNLIRSSWEAEKHPNQSQETKVCAFVPEQESEQELPHTSSVEPTDRESPVINTQNACVGLQKVRRKKRSPPKERRVPQDFTLPEIEKKHTKKKNLIRRAWEAVKHPNQSQETKVCAFVPEQEQELPHTSSVEPTDQKHTKKKNLIRRAWEAVKHPNQSQETKVCAFVPEQESEQELPHTSSVEPTDQKHTKKKNLIRRAWEAVKHPNQSQETKVCAFVPEQEQELPHTSSVEPTDQKHTKKKNLIRRAWEAVKHPNQSQETKVCAFVPEQESEQELPHTSSVEPTDQKHTKKKNLIRSSWEAEKHPNQSQETKVCAFVPEQESEQELPHTSSVEPTDRESPVINTQNACVGLQKVRRKKRSPPKERRVPQDFTLPEIEKKHTKKKNLIRRAWEAVKHPNQSQETKVCAFVPEQEQELPHTSSVEPTDQKHTKKKNLIRRAWEAVKHPNQSQETKVCAFVPEQEQELPHTSSVEPTDQKHTKKKNLIRRVWEAVKHPNQSQETKVCAFVPEQEQELPHTSSVEPTDRESAVMNTQNACVGLQKVRREKCPRPKRIRVPPYLTLGEIEIFKEHVRWCREIGFFEWSIEAREQHNSEYFRFLYEVGEKLGSENDEVHTHEGIRNSDGQKVAIKFVKPERQIGVRFKPVCEEARLMLKVQTPTTCEYIVKLYDWFIMDEKDVLIVEYHPSVTLPEFIKEYSDRLSEEVVKHIIWQLTIALRHCMELGVLHDADLENILINQDTMQIKLINFSYAMQLGPGTIRRGAVELIISSLHTAMKELIDGLPFEKKTHLSKECLDVLRKIQKNKALADTLDAILDHAWFKNHSQMEEERNQEK